MEGLPSARKAGMVCRISGTKTLHTNERPLPNPYKLKLLANGRKVMCWVKRLARPAVEDGHQPRQPLARSLRHGETKERQAPTGSAQIGRMIDGCPPSSSDLAGFSTRPVLGTSRMVPKNRLYYVLVCSRIGHWAE